jgi:hypothetical protein
MISKRTVQMCLKFGFACVLIVIGSFLTDSPNTAIKVCGIALIVYANCVGWTIQDTK